MARARRRDHEEEAPESHERWMITYADMVTLLMVLFIVMFAISQVDQKRFEELKVGFAAGFGQDPAPFRGAQSVLPPENYTPMEQVRPDLEGSAPGSPAARNVESRNPQTRTDSEAYAEAAAEVARLEKLRERIRKALAQKGLARDVLMQIDRTGLRISMVSRHIVFRANIADLSPRGRLVLDALVPVLREVDNAIDIDGHTNQVKVKPKYYPTDWELSAARAVTVLRYLNEAGRVPAHRLTAVAHGHERPLVDPARPGSQAMNKRVDVVLLSSLPEHTRDLFTRVLADRDTPEKL